MFLKEMDEANTKSPLVSQVSSKFQNVNALQALWGRFYQWLGASVNRPVVNKYYVPTQSASPDDVVDLPYELLGNRPVVENRNQNRKADLRSPFRVLSGSLPAVQYHFGSSEVPAHNARRSPES